MNWQEGDRRVRIVYVGDWDRWKFVAESYFRFEGSNWLKVAEGYRPTKGWALSAGSRAHRKDLARIEADKRRSARQKERSFTLKWKPRD